MNPDTDFKQEGHPALPFGDGLAFRSKDWAGPSLDDRWAASPRSPARTRLADFCLSLALNACAALAAAVRFPSTIDRSAPLFDMRRFRPVVTTMALIAALLVAGLLGTAYMTSRPDDAPPENLAPAAALDYAIKANVTGPILNDFGFGGYLIFRGIPTFIDGRTLPFGKRFALDFFDANSLGAGDRLEQLADAYKVSWTLLRPRSAAALHFDHSPGWRRIYADDVAVVHVRP